MSRIEDNFKAHKGFVAAINNSQTLGEALNIFKNSLLQSKFRDINPNSSLAADQTKELESLINKLTLVETCLFLNQGTMSIQIDEGFFKLPIEAKEPTWR
jgi:hypothetical protein